MSNAQRYFGVTDMDVVLKWDMNEYEALVKGHQLREIDKLERAAQVALFNRTAQHKPGKLKVAHIFDAEKVRRQVSRNEQDESFTSEKAKEAARVYEAINKAAASGELKFTPAE